MIITLAGLTLLSAVPDGGGGASQSPAIVALIVGITSSIAAVYSIIRQARGDRAQEKAAITTVAQQASDQSFNQIMATSKWQADQIIILQKESKEKDDKIDDLELQLAEADDELGKCKRDNARLRRLVREHGGTP